MLSMIVAMDKNGCIGKDNTLPWHIPMDLKWFKRITMGMPVVMGRKTRESIGRDLPGRENIVLSRNDGLTDFERRSKVLGSAVFKEIMIIGGASLYEHYLDYADRLYICHVDTEVEGGDTFFKPDLSKYRKVNSEKVSACKETGGYNIEFAEYRL